MVFEKCVGQVDLLHKNPTSKGTEAGLTIYEH